MGYVLAGWSIALTSLGLYAVRTLMAGRRLSARVPDDRRRWMHADD